MPSPRANYREVGSGPAVVCVHSSASSSGQWRALMDKMSDRWRVLAVDLYGYGNSPPWPDDRAMYLDDEIALLEPVFEAAGDGFHLVGHSFGGAIALKAALQNPGRLSSLIVYEPVLFSVLVTHDPDHPAAREIMAVRDDTVRLASLGDLEGTAARFVDYWLGRGAWAAMPEARRPAVVNGMRMVKADWHAAFQEPTPLAAFASIDVPTLSLTGSRSPAAARAVANLLCGVLPRVRAIELQGLGHMGPVTHPETVNEVVAAFLQEVQDCLVACSTGAGTSRPCNVPLQ